MPPPLKRLLLIALVFSPAIFTAKLVWEKAVDVGCWDSWENATVLQNWQDFRDGKTTGAEFGRFLYSSQIQHRIVVPRLLIIGLSHLGNGDFRWEQYFTFFILLLDAALIGLLLRRTVGEAPWSWALMLAVNLLLFCPIHYQILFWGSSMWGSLPVPCLLGILVLLAAPRGTGFWWRVILSMILAEIATHSFAHGLAIWPVLWLLVLLFHEVPLRRRVTAGILVALVAGVTIAFYFHNFINVAHHAYDLRPGDPAMKDTGSIFEGDRLAQAWRFFIAFLGSWFARTPFAEHPLGAARILGVVTFLLLAAVLAVPLLQKRPRSCWSPALPWLALAGYVLLVGLMISKRGADIGEHRAVTPRYLAISQFLLSALLALPFVFMGRNSSTANHASSKPGAWASALLAAFMMAQVPVWQYGLHLGNVWHHARLQAQALVLFLPHLKLPADAGDRKEMLDVLDKESRDWHCLDAINTLNRLGLLQFKPLTAPNLTSFTRDDGMFAGEARGRNVEPKAAITSARFLPDGSLEVLGNARFGAGSPADAILFSRGDQVVALGMPRPKPLLRIYGKDYEFSNVADVSIAGMHPWKAVIPSAVLSSEPEKLEAWALDVAARRIALLNAHLRINGSTQQVEVERAQ